ncbi:MAG: ATP-grasp domain-containing protein [Anaerolineae bacterium]|nr:ATP-grasp domain-containing protein [Thermoplasmata archaeon]NIV32287.1 ATP-grasp domain-containing protein [Anaerolineae bacterium]NIY03741.1 ATP-grasp domain-containing protein [Thermoplasmata archaeon]
MVRWVVQKNLGTSGDPERIGEACERIGAKCDLITRVPFSKELPNVPTDEPTIFYGSTRFVNLVFEAERWRPCAFFDPLYFTTQCWMEMYGSACLNHGAKITTLEQFCFEPHPSDRLFFVRPDKDLKEFQGGVWAFGDLKRWKTGLLNTDLGEEQLATIPILIGEPWGIAREWRLFMVDGRVCQASQYRVRHKLNVRADVPTRVLVFAEFWARQWSPHPIFVMDICESADQLYILEVGCVNSAGFYACDINEIVAWISSKVEDEWQTTE